MVSMPASTNHTGKAVFRLDPGNSPLRHLDAALAILVLLAVLAALAARQWIPFGPGDWAGYLFRYDQDALDLYRRGSAAFFYLAEAARATGLSAATFYLLLSISGIAIELAVFRRMRERLALPWIALAFLILPGFMLHDMIQLRTGLSQAMLMAALWSRIDARLGLTAVFCVLAAGFHMSALLFIPFIFLPRLSVAGFVVSLVVLGVALPNYEALLIKLRGVGGMGELTLAKSASLGSIVANTGVYALPLLAGEWFRRRHRDLQAVYAPTAWIVLACLIFYLGLRFLPSVPDVVVVRCHQAGWFGVAMLLTILAHDRLLRWLVSLPVTLLFVVYYIHVALKPV
ncbi:MAG: EpsG family protein [Candidatus Protistobacter heckmanni]|nr:EpsG family protein [Candidatus Protistobacter heckmanni]